MCVGVLGGAKDSDQFNKAVCDLQVRIYALILSSMQSQSVQNTLSAGRM
jgi:hypothetical protein